jgi:hypothetical protein
MLMGFILLCYFQGRRIFQSDSVVIFDKILLETADWMYPKVFSQRDL